MTALEEFGLNLAVVIAALAATVEAWRSRRAANRGTAQTETVVQAVTPGGDPDGLLRRLDRIEQGQADAAREQREIRRGLDRVETEMSTHIQLHTFMGTVRQRWPGDFPPPRPPAAREDDSGRPGASGVDPGL